MKFSAKYIHKIWKNDEIENLGQSMPYQMSKLTSDMAYYFNLNFLFRHYSFVYENF